MRVSIRPAALPSVTGLTVRSGVYANQLSWNSPERCAVYGSTTNNRGSATKLGVGSGGFTHVSDNNLVWYYWVIAVNNDDYEAGAWTPSSITGGLQANEGKIDLAKDVTGKLATGEIDGLGALALLNSVDASQVNNLGKYATANHIVANDITSGTLNASIVNVTNLNASNISTGILSADRIDSRGLSIRDTNGNIILSAGVNLDYNRVSNGPPANIGTTVQKLSNSLGDLVVDFNSLNNLDNSAITAPTMASNGTAIDHVINADGSADISVEWSWSGNEASIDGFAVYVYSSTSSAKHYMNTAPAAETVYQAPANKRAFILYGAAANKYYSFAIRAYRRVDSSVNSTGVINSALRYPIGTGEFPYRPSSSIAFSGNVTGTINGYSASTVASNANRGATFTSADAGNIAYRDTIGSTFITDLDVSKLTAGRMSVNDTGILGNRFYSQEWGYLYAPFLLQSTSTSNHVGLHVKKSGRSSNKGSAVYGEALASAYAGAGVVGTNYNNSTSMFSWGTTGWHFSTTNRSVGVGGYTNSTGNESSGGQFTAPFGGVGLRVTRGRVELGQATSNEGAEIRMNPAPGGQAWLIDVDGNHVFRIFRDSSPFPGIVLDTTGKLTATNGFSPFTGSHLAYVGPDFNAELGDIVEDTEDMYQLDISNAIGRVDVATTSNSKKAIGVVASELKEIPIPYEAFEEEVDLILGEGKTSAQRDEEKIVGFGLLNPMTVQMIKEAGAKQIDINSVGEGLINVCGQNGNIEIGDLIATSDMKGKGMRQDDDIVRNYTVAKSRERVIFNSPDEIKQIACIYMCG